MIIELNGRSIEYQLKVSNRRTLGLEVKHGGELVITAPRGATLPMIEKVLQKKKDWILKKINQHETSQRFQPLRKFVSGESLVLLGEEYIFQITSAERNLVEVQNKTIHVSVKNQSETFNTVPNKISSEAQILVSKWVAKTFEAKVQELTQKCLKHFNQTLGVNFAPTFKIRKMYKRWGSCSIDGRIHLSHSLFTAKPEWIEYVIYHELSHLIHHDHSANYYKVLGQVCLNHKNLKSDLQKNTVIYLNE